MESAMKIFDTLWVPNPYTLWSHQSMKCIDLGIQAAMTVMQSAPNSGEESVAIDAPMAQWLLRIFMKYRAAVNGSRRALRGDSWKSGFDVLFTNDRNESITTIGILNIIKRNTLSGFKAIHWSQTVDRYPLAPFVAANLSKEFARSQLHELATLTSEHAGRIFSTKVGNDSYLTVRQWRKTIKRFQHARDETWFSKEKHKSEYEEFLSFELGIASPPALLMQREKDARKARPPLVDRINDWFRGIREGKKRWKWRMIFPIFLIWWMYWVFHKVFISTVWRGISSIFAFFTFSLSSVLTKRPKQLASAILADIGAFRTRKRLHATIRAAVFSIPGLLYLAFLAFFIWLCVEGQNTSIFSFFFGGLGAAAWVIWIPLALEIILGVVAVMAVTWPSSPRLNEDFLAKRERALRDVCLMIACHKSEEVIETTLQYALGMTGNCLFFRPEQIYICHNGNFEKPIDDTASVVERVSAEYNRLMGRSHEPSTSVQYHWTNVGNKTHAFYTACKDFVHPRFKYCLLIDDDVQLPPDLYVPTEECMKGKTRGMAFGISAFNMFSAAKRSKRNVVALQDFEYKKNDLFKAFQSKYGSTLYGHGAIQMWERKALLEIFWEHNTEFHGEDLRMGVVAMKRGWRIETVINVPAKTTVPDHLSCWDMFWCRHGIKSLLIQRVRSWDAAAHRNLFVYLNLLLFYWNFNLLIMKPFLIYEIITIIVDWIRFPVLVAALIFMPWFTLAFIAVLLLISLLFAWLFNGWTLRDRIDLRAKKSVVLLFPLYQLILLVFRFLGLLYSLFHWIPTQRMAPKLKNWGFYSGHPADMLPWDLRFELDDTKEIIRFNRRATENFKSIFEEIRCILGEPYISMVNTRTKETVTQEEVIMDKADDMDLFRVFSSKKVPPNFECRCKEELDALDRKMNVLVSCCEDVQGSIAGKSDRMTLISKDETHSKRIVKRGGPRGSSMKPASVSFEHHGVSGGSSRLASDFDSDSDSDPDSVGYLKREGSDSKLRRRRVGTGAGEKGGIEGDAGGGGGIGDGDTGADIEAEKGVKGVKGVRSDSSASLAKEPRVRPGMIAGLGVRPEDETEDSGKDRVDHVEDARIQHMMHDEEVQTGAAEDADHVRHDGEEGSFRMGKRESSKRRIRESGMEDDVVSVARDQTSPASGGTMVSSVRDEDSQSGIPHGSSLQIDMSKISDKGRHWKMGERRILAPSESHKEKDKDKGKGKGKGVGGTGAKIGKAGGRYDGLVRVGGGWMTLGRYMAEYRRMSSIDSSVKEALLTPRQGGGRRFLAHRVGGHGEIVTRELGGMLSKKSAASTPYKLWRRRTVRRSAVQRY
eukprot:TRINITY_DN2020_c0_g1_i1.p1 TRINITY_DN2020_c0_g1~~TRINITY_DN2020_c0_g1_i1.p1  ORF type:complete len:1361 (+),score=333.58 TRINITY_DN2020_c0_g1_i1:111-4085(+)